jgi:uncharacterized membrane protein
MIQQLRRTFVAGFFVIVPLVVSVMAIIWLFQWVDGVARLGIEEPPPGTGILATAFIVLAVGLVTRNVLGRRLLQRTEQVLMYVPLFRTIYAPVKQLISAFSPDSETGFKRVVFIEDPVRGFQLGFLTKEFTLDRGRGPEVMLAVYVPTNHLYLGDVVLCPPERAVFPRMTVEEGIRVFLTGGMALPGRIVAELPELAHPANSVTSATSDP